MADAKVLVDRAALDALVDYADGMRSQVDGEFCVYEHEREESRAEFAALVAALGGDAGGDDGGDRLAEVIVRKILDDAVNRSGYFDIGTGVIDLHVDFTEDEQAYLRRLADDVFGAVSGADDDQELSYEAGQDDERAAIVAWLHDKASTFETDYGSLCSDLAKSIQRGEHRS